MEELKNKLNKNESFNSKSYSELLELLKLKDQTFSLEILNLLINNKKANNIFQKDIKDIIKGKDEDNSKYNKYFNFDEYNTFYCVLVLYNLNQILESRKDENDFIQKKFLENKIWKKYIKQISKSDYKISLNQIIAKNYAISYLIDIYKIILHNQKDISLYQNINYCFENIIKENEKMYHFLNKMSENKMKASLLNKIGSINMDILIDSYKKIINKLTDLIINDDRMKIYILEKQNFQIILFDGLLKNYSCISKLLSEFLINIFNIFKENSNEENNNKIYFEIMELLFDSSLTKKIFNNLEDINETNFSEAINKNYEENIKIFMYTIEDLLNYIYIYKSDVDKLISLVKWFNKYMIPFLYIKNIKNIEFNQNFYELVYGGICNLIGKLIIKLNAIITKENFKNLELKLDKKKLFDEIIFNQCNKKENKKESILDSNSMQIKLKYTSESINNLFLLLIINDFNKSYESKEKLDKKGLEESIDYYLKSLDEKHQQKFWIGDNEKSWRINHKDKIKTNKYVGLRNLGNTCFMNSLIQILFNIGKLRDGIMNSISENKKKNCLYELKKVFYFLQYSSMQYYEPISFPKNFEDSPLNPHEQMDIDEFFATLMDKLETRLKGTKNENLIKYIFQGKLNDNIIFEDCHHRRTNISSFYSIQLQVKNKKNIYESLDSFIEGEYMEGENAIICETCKRKISSKKNQDINILPRILIFVLKRFEFDYNTMNRYKLNDHFEFPLELDMNKYTSDYINGINKNNNNKYLLRGCVIHSGNSESGHYYAIIKNIDTKNEDWFKYNDSVVTKYDIEDLKEEAFGDEIIEENNNQNNFNNINNNITKIENNSIKDNENKINKNFKDKASNSHVNMKNPVDIGNDNKNNINNKIINDKNNENVNIIEGIDPNHINNENKSNDIINKNINKEDKNIDNNIIKNECQRNNSYDNKISRNDDINNFYNRNNKNNDKITELNTYNENKDNINEDKNENEFDFSFNNDVKIYDTSEKNNFVLGNINNNINAGDNNNNLLNNNNNIIANKSNNIENNKKFGTNLLKKFGKSAYLLFYEKIDQNANCEKFDKIEAITDIPKLPNIPDNKKKITASFITFKGKYKFIKDEENSENYELLKSLNDEINKYYLLKKLFSNEYHKFLLGFYVNLLNYYFPIENKIKTNCETPINFCLKDKDSIYSDKYYFYRRENVYSNLYNYLSKGKLKLFKLKDVQNTVADNNQKILNLFKHLIVFFFNIKIRTNERKCFGEFVDLIKFFLNNFTFCCEYFLEEFTTYNVIVEYLINCNLYEIKKLIVGIINCAMINIMQVFRKNQKIEEEKLIESQKELKSIQIGGRTSKKKNILTFYNVNNFQSDNKNGDENKNIKNEDISENKTENKKFTDFNEVKTVKSISINEEKERIRKLNQKKYLPKIMIQFINNILYLIQTIGINNYSETKFLYYILYRFSIISSKTKEYFIEIIPLLEFMNVKINPHLSHENTLDENLIKINYFDYGYSHDILDINKNINKDNNKSEKSKIINDKGGKYHYENYLYMLYYNLLTYENNDPIFSFDNSDFIFRLFNGIVNRQDCFVFSHLLNKKCHNNIKRENIVLDLISNLLDKLDYKEDCNYKLNINNSRINIKDIKSYDIDPRNILLILKLFILYKDNNGDFNNYRIKKGIQILFELIRKYEKYYSYCILLIDFIIDLFLYNNKILIKNKIQEFEKELNNIKKWIEKNKISPKLYKIEGLYMYRGDNINYDKNININAKEIEDFKQNQIKISEEKINKLDKIINRNFNKEEYFLNNDLINISEFHFINNDKIQFDGRNAEIVSHLNELIRIKFYGGNIDKNHLNQLNEVTNENNNRNNENDNKNVLYKIWVETDNEKIIINKLLN